MYGPPSAQQQYKQFPEPPAINAYQFEGSPAYHQDIGTQPPASVPLSVFQIPGSGRPPGSSPELRQAVDARVGFVPPVSGPFNPSLTQEPIDPARANRNLIETPKVKTPASPVTTENIIPPVRGGILLTPVSKNVAAGRKAPSNYDTSRPTCSLILVCYRTGTGGPCTKQLQTTTSEKWLPTVFSDFKAKNPSCVTTDQALFREMKRVYEQEMCTFFRRHFSLKTLRAFRILVVSRDGICLASQSSSTGYIE